MMQTYFALCLKCVRLVSVVLAMMFADGLARADVITYYHNDLLGSPRVATNASGQVVWTESYTPHGQRLNGPLVSNKIWYTSRHQDDDTGLVYIGARFYDPVVGRFMSVDPRRFDPSQIQSFNRYSYAANNPYKYIDPDGRWVQLAARAVYFGSYEAATAAGAATLGSLVGIGLHQWMHAEAAEPSANGEKGGDSSKALDDGKVSDGRDKRLFDKDQAERARNRSRDQDGDPTCEYCGVKTTNEPGRPNSSQIDHIDAWSKGGKTTEENAANSCRTCNASKGSKELGTEWVPPGPWR
jgi:RHS repeat-associated protein